MKKLIYIFLIFYSCGSITEENVKPNNLIPEDKMIDILYDMSLISVSKGINKRILENNGMKPKKYIPSCKACFRTNPNRGTKWGI